MHTSTALLRFVSLPRPSTRHHGVRRSTPTTASPAARNIGYSLTHLVPWQWHESVIHNHPGLQVVYVPSSSGGGLFRRPETRKSFGTLAFWAGQLAETPPRRTDPGPGRFSVSGGMFLHGGRPRTRPDQLPQPPRKVRRQRAVKARGQVRE